MNSPSSGFILSLTFVNAPCKIALQRSLKVTPRTVLSSDCCLRRKIRQDEVPAGHRLMCSQNSSDWGFCAWQAAYRANRMAYRMQNKKIFRRCSETRSGLLHLSSYTKMLGICKLKASLSPYRRLFYIRQTATFVPFVVTIIYTNVTFSFLHYIHSVNAVQKRMCSIY